MIKTGLLLLLATASLADAAPPSDADFKAMSLTDGMATRDLCGIERHAGEARGLALTYAAGGHVTRTEVWRDGKKLSTEAYSWSGNKVVAIDDNGDKQTLTYGANGLPATWVTKYGTTTYRWKVKPVTAPPATYASTSHLYTSHMPNQIPFTGSVDLAEVSARDKSVSKSSYAFDAHGTMVPEHCTIGNDGHVAGCTDEDGTDTLTWTGGELTERLSVMHAQSTPETNRLAYAYDAKHRVTREQSFVGPTKAKLQETDETRWEWRCDDVGITDPVWSR